LSGSGADSVTTMETRTTTVLAADGRSLCVESGGDPAGRPVLVHGGTPSSRLMPDSSLKDAEQRGIWLISYDRPGYGGSTPQPDRTVADCAEDVRAVATALGLERLAIWGISGGGPHALACAALLPDLVSAVASLASLAPYGAPGLDYFTGMGEANVDDIELYFSDPVAARLKCKQDREEVLAATPENLFAGLGSLLSPTDAAALTFEFASFLVANNKIALAPGDEGWWDDGAAHVAAWGFNVEDIQVPVQLWHGVHDQFVPYQHGQWLAERIPGVDAHLTETDGHITLAVNRIPEVHEWLLRQP
jgi:pimeloyl-ACP methyl ester carboxylesterase